MFTKSKETHLNFRDLSRMREIAVVFFEEGFDVLIEEMKLKYLLPIKYKLKKDKFSVFRKNGSLKLKKEFPVRLRKAFERLGPTFVKLGQILSLRPDILPLEFTKELEKLQSNVEPISFEEVKAILEREMQKPLYEVFLKIDLEPIGSASLAQVHRAVLRTGEEVAIKVQRPNIKEKIESDIHILFYLAGLLEKHMDEAKNFQPVRVVKEFADWTTSELDFSAEGKNADRFRFNFREDKNIYIPKIYWDYSSSKVLVMEMIYGLKVENLDELSYYNIERKQLALNCIQAGFQMFFYDGFFHADPHPGNFLFLNDNRLCLYDFGIVGYLDSKIRDKLINIFLSFINKDIDSYIKHLLSVTQVSENADLQQFNRDASQVLSGLMFASKAGNISRSLYDIINAAGKYGIIFPTEFVLFGKALITIEAMGMKIYPELDFNSELSPFIKKIYAKKFSPKKIKYELQNLSLDYLSLLKNLPEQTQNLLAKLETGKFSVKIDKSELLDLKHEIDRQNDIKILVFIIIALIISSAILLRVEKAITFLGLTIGQAGVLASVFLLVWVLVLVKRRE